MPARRAYAHAVIAKLVALVLPLGLDTFAVAAALGMIGVSSARWLRISLLFTAFEGGMPLIGLALGTRSDTRSAEQPTTSPSEFCSPSASTRW